MRVLVCGDRNWWDYYAIERVLDKVQPSCVINGQAIGADKLADTAAVYLKIPVERYPADWNKFGKAAGPIRNQQMLDEGKPDIVVAFHDHLTKKRGTYDMIRRAHKAGVPWVHYGHDKQKNLEMKSRSPKESEGPSRWVD